MIDVKQPPYSAVGDGVTDDTQAIQNAINAAQAGEVIMLSSGKYLCGPLVGRSDRPLLLTGTVGAQIIAKPNTRTLLTIRCSASNVFQLEFVGAALTSVQPFLASSCIRVNDGLSGVVIEGCKVSQFSGAAIIANASMSLRVMNCDMSTGQLCVQAARARNIVLEGNTFHDLGQSGFALHGDGIIIRDNVCYRAGPVGGFGAVQAGSKNILITGNHSTDGGGGFELQNENALSATEPSGSSCVVAGNSFTRTFAAGIDLFRSGVVLTGNVFNDCNFAAGLPTAFTVQPGIVPDLAGPGSGYQAGDILTLGGGVFTRPARFVLNAPSPNGGLCDPARPATNGNTYVIDMGDYSVFPTNPANVTGGHGTGGKVIYTNANIKARGSGYKSGDVLRGSTGTSRFPVLVRVNIIDANGAVLEAEILFGGYYTGTLPTEMAFAAYDTVSSGSGFTLLPCFGNRYAMQYSKPSMASGGSILGIGNRNVIVSGNSIVNHSPSHDCGILFVNFLNAPVSRWAITGNVFGTFSKGAIKRYNFGTLSYDTAWGAGMVISGNVGYP